MIYIFPEIHLWCDICSQHDSQLFPHMHVSTEIECANHPATATGFFQKTQMSPFFIPFKKRVKYSPMMLFTHNVKKIKDAIHKNCNVDVACKLE